MNIENQSYRILVSTQQEAEEIQKIFFAFGYKWAWQRYAEQREVRLGFFIKTFHKSRSLVETTCTDHQEITLTELREAFQKSPWGQIESLKAQLEAKSNANKFLDGCRIEWHELAMRKDEELREVKAQLAQLQAELLKHQSDTWISVDDHLPENGQDVLAVTSIVSCQFDDNEFLDEFYDFDTGHSYQEAIDVTHWKPMIEAQEQSNDAL